MLYYKINQKYSIFEEIDSENHQKCKKRLNQFNQHYKYFEIKNTIISKNG
jgi:hypothetical protein